MSQISTKNNNYQTSAVTTLLKNIENHLFIEVGVSHNSYSLVAASHDWTVKSFEMNPKNYSGLCRDIRNNHLENKITPIYTKIGLQPSLDQFITHQKVGIIKINTDENATEIVDGLKYSLEQQIIDSLIIDISPKSKPTNIWINLLVHIEKYGYNIYDLEKSCKLVPYNIDDIHQTSETTLLFLKKGLLINEP